jgi:hypothetical protein
VIVVSDDRGYAGDLGEHGELIGDIIGTPA